jgi:hypothetical protein
MRYTTDDFARGLSTEGRLKLDAGGNRFHDDYMIGRLGDPGDVGFHAGADQFGFQGGPLNVSPGNGSLNLREYKTFENYLKGHLEAGSTVDASFNRVFYPGNLSSRPNEYVIQYSIDSGPTRTRTFINEAGGGQ